MFSWGEHASHHLESKVICTLWVRIEIQGLPGGSRRTFSARGFGVVVKEFGFQEIHDLRGNDFCAWIWASGDLAGTESSGPMLVCAWIWLPGLPRTGQRLLEKLQKGFELQGFSDGLEGSEPMPSARGFGFVVDFVFTKSLVRNIWPPKARMKNER